MGLGVSSSHAVSAAPSISGGGLLTLCPCSIMGSHPWETFFHELVQLESFSQGAVLQEQAAPAWIPHGVTIPASKPVPTWAPLSTGPQVLLEACSSTRSPHGHCLLWVSVSSGLGSSPGFRWISAPPWTSMGCGGTACLSMVFSMGSRGISALAPGAPPPPLSLMLVSAELSLLWLQSALMQRFFSS